MLYNNNIKTSHISIILTLTHKSFNLKAGLNESSGKGKLVGKAKGNKGRASTGSIQKKDGRASARVHNKALQQQQTLIDGMEQQLHDKVIRPLKTESGASLLLNPVREYVVC